MLPLTLVCACVSPTGHPLTSMCAGILEVQQRSSWCITRAAILALHNPCLALHRYSEAKQQLEYRLSMPAMTATSKTTLQLQVRAQSIKQQHISCRKRQSGIMLLACQERLPPRLPQGGCAANVVAAFVSGREAHDGRGVRSCGRR